LHSTDLDHGRRGWIGRGRGGRHDRVRPPGVKRKETLIRERCFQACARDTRRCNDKCRVAKQPRWEIRAHSKSFFDQMDEPPGKLRRFNTEVTETQSTQREILNLDFDSRIRHSFSSSVLSVSLRAPCRWSPFSRSSCQRCGGGSPKSSRDGLSRASLVIDRALSIVSRRLAIMARKSSL
jgi:hypothetical protein